MRDAAFQHTVLLETNGVAISRGRKVLVQLRDGKAAAPRKKRIRSRPA